MSLLFKPLKIKNLVLKNRLVRSATSDSMSDSKGRITDAQIKLYERLAKGGVGLIETGFASVHKTGMNIPYGMRIDNNSFIPGLKRLTDVAHQYNSKIVVQLAHGGAQANPDAIGTRPLAPSCIFQPTSLMFTPLERKPRPSLLTAFTHKMTEKDIWMIIDAYGKSAKIAVKSGFDGVQIHSAHGYLVNQFLASRTNHRTDKWGKNREGRVRFLKEVYRAIRKAVGDDYPILIKMNIKDYIIGGIDVPYGLYIAKVVSNIGIDAIEISGGVYETALFVSRGQIPLDMYIQSFPLWVKYPLNALVNNLRLPFNFKPAYFREYAVKVKEVISCPLILVGGLRNLEMMEEILENKEADLIALSRPLIRNPNLPKLMKRGKIDQSDCSNCNRCLAAVSLNKPLRCYVKET